MPTRVTVYETGLIQAFNTDGRPWNRRVANEVMALAVATCPKGASGELERSHSVSQNRGAFGRFTAGFNVSNDARHALWVHNGTGLYGPNHRLIVPVNTPQRKYMHVPPNMGWLWTSGWARVAPGPGGRIRLHDSGDPFGHAESVEGQRAQPWLRRAGDVVAARHGAF